MPHRVSPVKQDGTASPLDQTEPSDETPDNVTLKDNEPPNEPVSKKDMPWKLPLLIAVFLIAGGGIVAWRCLKQK